MNGFIPLSRLDIKDAIHQLFDHVEEISVQGYNEQRQVVYWNIGSQNLYGYTQDEAIGQRLEDLIIPAFMKQAVIDGHANWLENGIEIPASELVLHTKQNTDVSVFSSHVMFTDDKNEKTMYCVDFDLFEVKNAQAQAIIKENLLKAVFEATPDMFFVTDASANIIDFHIHAHQITHLSQSPAITQTILSIFSQKVRLRFQQYFAEALNTNDVITFEYAVHDPAKICYYEARLRHLVSEQQVVVILRDISEQHQSAQLTHQHAYFDSLTKLPNRNLLSEKLTLISNMLSSKPRQTAVLLVNLNDFKKVNDSLGHNIGDKILIEAASRIQNTIQDPDTVGRLGGDEFIVLMGALKNANGPEGLARRLVSAFTIPFLIGRREILLSLSIGIYVSTNSDNEAMPDISKLIRYADTAMRQAKSRGQNQYSVFTNQMSEQLNRRDQIEHQLTNALINDELHLHFQPKLDISSNAVMGAEALIRWDNKALGNIRPDEFIPIAEQTGLIVPIGKFVISKALAFLQQWQNKYQQSFSMAINLSPRQFKDIELIAHIKKSVAFYKIKPSQIEFEITEGVLLKAAGFVKETLAELHDFGVKLAMDDFGTGYSSLSYLREYSFDVLKVDRSFISGTPEQQSDCDLVRATIAMGHSLNLKVVAEGVESEAQLTLLKTLGCDYVQGFYFCRPIPEQDLLEHCLRYKPTD